MGRKRRGSATTPYMGRKAEGAEENTALISGTKKSISKEAPYGPLKKGSESARLVRPTKCCFTRTHAPQPRTWLKVSCTRTLDRRTSRMSRNARTTCTKGTIPWLCGCYYSTLTGGLVTTWGSPPVSIFLLWIRRISKKEIIFFPSKWGR